MCQSRQTDWYIHLNKIDDILRFKTMSVTWEFLWNIYTETDLNWHGYIPVYQFYHLSAAVKITANFRLEIVA